MRVWDKRTMQPVKKIFAHSNDVLSIDFNKYENFLATSSTDNLIKIFDLRSTLETPMLVLPGHTLAVKKIKFSPYHANILASSSYDMSVCVWDCNSQMQVNKFEQHSEFVTGLDFNLFVENQLASASWDGRLSVFSVTDSKQRVEQTARFN